MMVPGLQMQGHLVTVTQITKLWDPSIECLVYTRYVYVITVVFAKVRLQYYANELAGKNVL